MKRVVLIVIGLLFLSSGILKAIDSKEFAILIAKYGFGWAGYLAPVITGIEVVLGFCLILGVKPRLTSFSVFIITIFFTIVFAYAFFAKGIQDCGCMGPFVKVPAYISFLRNILVIAGCFWIWQYSENDNGATPKWKMWIVYSTGALAFYIAGYTLSGSIVKKHNFKIGEQVSETSLRFFNDKIAEGTAMVFLFSPNCGHCWNATPILNAYKEYPEYSNVLGITFQGEDLSGYINDMHPNFPVYNYPTAELNEVLHETPILLMLENGKIKNIFLSGNIPCGRLLREMNHPH